MKLRGVALGHDESTLRKDVRKQADKFFGPGHRLHFKFEEAEAEDCTFGGIVSYRAGFVAWVDE